MKESSYRFIIARKIRVVFQMKDNNLIILVLRVGKKKIYIESTYYSSYRSINLSNSVSGNGLEK